MIKGLNLKSFVIFSTPSLGGMVELGDTLHLGCSAARRGSSNLSTPTRQATSLGLVAELVLAIIKICCDTCCVANKMLQSRKGMYRKKAASRRLVSLRNQQPNPYIPTTAYFLAIPVCFI